MIKRGAAFSRHCLIRLIILLIFAPADENILFTLIFILSDADAMLMLRVSLTPCISRHALIFAAADDRATAAADDAESTVNGLPVRHNLHASQVWHLVVNPPLHLVHGHDGDAGLLLAGVGATKLVETEKTWGDQPSTMVVFLQHNGAAPAKLSVDAPVHRGGEPISALRREHPA